MSVGSRSSSRKQGPLWVLGGLSLSRRPPRRTLVVTVGQRSPLFLSSILWVSFFCLEYTTQPPNALRSKRSLQRALYPKASASTTALRVLLPPARLDASPSPSLPNGSQIYPRPAGCPFASLCLSPGPSHTSTLCPTHPSPPPPHAPSSSPSPTVHIPPSHTPLPQASLITRRPPITPPPITPRPLAPTHPRKTWMDGCAITARCHRPPPHKPPYSRRP